MGQFDELMKLRPDLFEEENIQDIGTPRPQNMLAADEINAEADKAMNDELAAADSAFPNEQHMEEQKAEQIINHPMRQLMTENLATPSVKDLNPGFAPEGMPPQGSRIQSKLDQLRELVGTRNKNDSYLNLLQSARMIGQGLTGRYSGKFDVDTKDIDALRKSNEAPVQDFGTLQKAEKTESELTDEAKIRDPQTKISEFYRMLARKNGLEVSDDMSAFDIAPILKLKQAGAAKPSYRYERIKDADGVTRTKVYDGVNLVGTLGQTGFADQIRVNPHDKELMAISPSNPTNNIRQITGPVSNVLAPSTIPEEKDMGIEVTAANLNAKQAGDLAKTREAFIKEVEPNREAIGAAKGTVAMLTAGKELNGDILRLIQNQLARASGEKGAMTDNDVRPFQGRAGALDTIKRILQYKTVGELPDKDRKFLSDIANVMQTRAQEGVRDISQFYTTNLKTDFEGAKNFNGQKINPRSIERLLGVEAAQMNKAAPAAATVRQKTADGRWARFDKATGKFLGYEK